MFCTQIHHHTLIVHDFPLCIWGHTNPQYNTMNCDVAVLLIERGCCPLSVSYNVLSLKLLMSFSGYSTFMSFLWNSFYWCDQCLLPLSCFPCSDKSGRMESGGLEMHSHSLARVSYYLLHPELGLLHSSCWRCSKTEQNSAIQVIESCFYNLEVYKLV